MIQIILLNIGPGPLNITFGSDMPITLLHLMLMSKIYVVKSDMKNVIGMSDLNVMFKGPGPMGLFTWSMSPKVKKNSMDFQNLAVVLK